MNKTAIREKMQLYFRKLEEAKQREMQRLQQRAEWMGKFQGLAKDIIRPVMENFSKEMESDVCKFRIDGEYEHGDDPQIRYWITPVGISLNEYEFKDVPHIFYGIDTGVGEIITHISTVVKGKAGRIYEGPTYKIEDVTAEVVERDLTKVLGELMDNLLAS